jgi:hypothetical protein
MAPALLSSPPTNGHIANDSDASSPDVSVENSPHLSTISKVSSGVINNAPGPKSLEGNDTITVMSTKILEIIFDYALNKFDDSRDRLEVGRPRFIEVLNEFVRAGSRIDMALPAFPFKSANKVYKALRRSLYHGYTTCADALRRSTSRVPMWSSSRMDLSIMVSSTRSTPRTCSIC